MDDLTLKYQMKFNDLVGEAKQAALNKKYKVKEREDINIITGYNPVEPSLQNVLDLVVYDIPAV